MFGLVAEKPRDSDGNLDALEGTREIAAIRLDDESFDGTMWSVVCGTVIIG